MLGMYSTIQRMKKTIIIVAILLVVALAAYLLIFKGNSYERDPVKNSPVTGKNPSEVSTAPYDPTTAATVPTDDWLVYTDAEAGFSFKYPPTHAIGEKFGQGEGVNIYSMQIEPGGADEPQESDAKDSVNRLGVDVTNQSVEEAINAYRSSDSAGLEFKEIAINGLSGYLVIHQYPPTGEYMNNILFTLPRGDTLSLSYSNRTLSDGKYPSMTAPNSIYDTVLQSVQSLK